MDGLYIHKWMDCMKKYYIKYIKILIPFLHIYI